LSTTIDYWSNAIAVLSCDSILYEKACRNLFLVLQESLFRKCIFAIAAGFEENRAKEQNFVDPIVHFKVNK